ncbi:unnamed protein product [Polarella glacialis]|uniref:Uncharacterized protein n=1 Tax=Polarella glacialis TaxID=89957 RepID=A0A813EYE2_POLGL|nr:unnamed protein product [Polarella glacialis]
MPTTWPRSRTQTATSQVSSQRASLCAWWLLRRSIQKAYTVMYNAALILNLIMDISLQAVLSYLQMVGVGAHVADGRLLGSLTSFQEIFESYPIQKSVGKLLFKYCWPCTFLVPFLAEPFVAQWLPWQTAKWLVGANPKIKGENAEKAFELGEMEQGRYADCIFNVILVACIPFIAPAYIHLTFGALIVSHLYIYCFDQTKAGSSQYNKPLTHNSDGTNNSCLLLFPLFCLLFPSCSLLVGLAPEGSALRWLVR